MSATTQAIGDLTRDHVIDPAHTRIGFVARHAMVTKVRGSFTEFEGKTTINHKDFGVTTNLALETGGVLVGDKITLELDVSLIRS